MILYRKIHFNFNADITPKADAEKDPDTDMEKETEKETEREAEKEAEKEMEKEAEKEVESDSESEVEEPPQITGGHAFLVLSRRDSTMVSPVRNHFLFLYSFVYEWLGC